MQGLKAHENEFDNIEDGKCCTIRKGHREIKLGNLIFWSREENRQMVVNVTQVIHSNVNDLPLYFAKEDYFVDKHDLVHQMQTFYPDINEETEVTAIIFKK